MRDYAARMSKSVGELKDESPVETSDVPKTESGDIDVRKMYEKSLYDVEEKEGKYADMIDRNEAPDTEFRLKLGQLGQDKAAFNKMMIQRIKRRYKESEE